MKCENDKTWKWKSGGSWQDKKVGKKSVFTLTRNVGEEVQVQILELLATTLEGFHHGGQCSTMSEGVGVILTKKVAGQYLLQVVLGGGLVGVLVSG